MTNQQATRKDAESNKIGRKNQNETRKPEIEIIEGLDILLKDNHQNNHGIRPSPNDDDDSSCASDVDSVVLIRQKLKEQNERSCSRFSLDDLPDDTDCFVFYDNGETPRGGEGFTRRRRRYGRSRRAMDSGDMEKLESSFSDFSFHGPGDSE